LKKAAARVGVLPDEVRDYRLLLERWLELTRRVPSLSLSVFGEAGGYPLIVAETQRADPAATSIYLSAGVHGDEPAPVESLIQWAEKSAPQGLFDKVNLMIFPCLNPWGLERNIRFDSQGRDLNRFYHSKKVPQIAAQLHVMKGRRFHAAACLHEDYDARGFYLYEIASKRTHWGEDLCRTLAPVMPSDERRTIDGHPCRKGVIRRRVTPALMRGHPEAFLLHFKHADRTITLETPSERGLEERICLQKGFLDAFLRKSRIH
jgi:hypothetical protein